MHEIGVREVVQFAGFTFNWETGGGNRGLAS